MTTPIDIRADHLRIVEDVLRRHLPDGVKVWVFGSRATWATKDSSDLDLALEGDDEIPARSLTALESAFEESDLPYAVDIVDVKRIGERFREIVAHQRVALPERDGSRSSTRSCGDPFGALPPGWERSTLGAACERGGGNIQTGPFGSQLHASDYRPVGIPSIMPQNLGDNRVIADGIARIGDRDAGRLRRYLVREGDIVYSRRGDVEKRAIIRPREDGWLCGTGCLRVRLGKNGADPRYASYYLGHPAVREWIVRHAHGATMPNLNTAILSACPFVAPPIPDQRAIAHILGTLDDKIELNRHMDVTLEEMAHALFRSWFVYFSPVRAKMEGRDTGLPKDIADLFPSRMVSSELGEIPVGWEVKPLRDLLDLAYGSALKADSRRQDGNVPVYGSSGQVGWHDRSLVQGPGIVVGRKGNPGTVMWVSTDFFPIDTTYYVVPKDNYTPHFLFFALKVQNLSAIAADSVVPGLNRNLAYTNKQVVPPSRIVEHFDRYVGPAFTRKCTMRVESLSLALLRNTLLPRLISGDLRVRDADSFLRRAL